MPGMAAPAGSAATPAPAAAGAPETSGDEVHPEVLLWSCPEMYVYQIPPLKSESGHRANDWDVNKWLWTGKLCVYAIGNVMQVRLLDATGGGLFAMCPVTEPSSKAIDPVVDSSRYFVLRIDDGKGRHAFIGMGFRDRDDSYNFNATLQDHWKGVARQKEADSIREEAELRSTTEPMRDMSLKDGEKINIKVNLPKGEGRKHPRPASGSGIGLPPPPGAGLLPPPPSGRLPPPKPGGPPAAPVSADSTTSASAGAGGTAEPGAADVSGSAAGAPAGASGDADFGNFAEAGTEASADDSFGDFATA